MDSTSLEHVFLLQINLSLNAHKTVMYRLICDNLWTRGIFPKHHMERSAFCTIKKRQLQTHLLVPSPCGQACRPQIFSSRQKGCRGAVRVAGGQRRGMGSNGRLGWGCSSSKLQRSHGRGSSVAGWIGGDEAAAEHWFGVLKCLGWTETVESKFKDRSAVCILCLEAELWTL